MTILCTIDLLTREVFLPADQRIAAYDHNVDVIRFQAEPVDDFNFDTSSIKIAAKGPNKVRHDYPVDPSTVQIEEETGYITFDWPIPAGVTEMPEDTFGYGATGQLIFAVCAEIISGSSLSKAWHSDDGIITVVAHLEPESGGGEDPEEEATNAQKIAQLQTDVAVINTQVGALANGSPTPVATVAEMTDESAVYLYTGSETGYTAGNWYYYDGSAWTSGGTYGGATTSTTFDKHGVPADDFAVGEALAEKADASDVTSLGARVTDAEGDIGDLTQLDTTAKTDLVSAINEVAQNTSSDYILLNDANNQKWKITISTTGVLTTERYVEPSTIQRTLSNVNYYEDFEGFADGQEYIETFIAMDGYTMEGATVSVTMGGVDITSSVYSDLGAVIIPEVTGDVVISIQAVQISYVVPPASDFTLQLYGGKQALKAYVGTDTAIEVPTTLTVDGQEYQTSMWECTFPSTVEHIKLNAIPATYGSATSLAPKIPNTVKTLWLVGDDGRSYNTPTSAERIVRPSSCKILGNARTRVTSLRDAVYQSSLTSLSSGCSGATSLVDGGTIPSAISNIYYLFNGATKLRRARIEGKTFSNFSGCFTGVPKRAKVQLYIDSDIYTSYRNNASNGQSTNDNSIPVMFESIDPTTPIRYLFCIGDSLTLGTGSTTQATDSYPALLKGMFSADVFVKNVGAGSTTSANHLNTMNSAPLNYYYGNKNNGFVIWSGTNGVNSTVRSDIQSMVNLLDGNEHYLIIPAAVTGGGYTYEQQLAWALETFGADHVFDVYGYFSDNGYDRAEYMSDSLHYNTAGYAIIADGIYDKISGWF